VAISGDTAFIGAFGLNDDKGAAYVYFPYRAEDLGVAVYADNLSPHVTQAVNFTITVTNYASNPSKDVMVSVPLPAGFTLARAYSALGSYNPITGNWTIASIGANVIATLSLRGIVTHAAAGTTPVFSAALLGWDSYYLNNTASVTLNQVPVLDFSSTSLTFPGQLIQTASPSQSVMLFNESLGSLTMGTLVAPTGFVLSANTCSGHTLLPSTACTFSVQFKPVTASSYAASLTIPVASPAASRWRARLSSSSPYFSILKPIARRRAR
jgi:uncharacterized repeat protein (TIGR01451 family)